MGPTAAIQEAVFGLMGTLCFEVGLALRANLAALDELRSCHA